MNLIARRCIIFRRVAYDFLFTISMIISYSRSYFFFLLSITKTILPSFVSLSFSNITYNLCPSIINAPYLYIPLLITRNCFFNFLSRQFVNGRVYFLRLFRYTLLSRLYDESCYAYASSISYRIHVTHITHNTQVCF